MTKRTSKLTVVAFLEGIEEIGGVSGISPSYSISSSPFDRHLGAVLQREHVGGVLEVFFLDRARPGRLRD
jgi:hypothetical protein